MKKPREKYQPSNGTEGMGFMEHWCERCERERPYYEKGEEGCEILLRSMAFGIDDPQYPSEWTYNDNGSPICTAFIPEGEEVKVRCDKTMDMFGDNI